MPDASFSATTLAEQLDPLFHAALSRAKQAQATGDALEITDAAGKVLIRATK